MKMRTPMLVLALGAAMASAGIAHAGPSPATSVVKRIRLTASIGDSLFASVRDRSTGRDVVELAAVDRDGKTLGATLPIRVWTTGDDFDVTLARPVTFPNGIDGAAGAQVTLASQAGEVTLAPDGISHVKQVKHNPNGDEAVHTLRIRVDASAGAGAAGMNRRDVGELVMLFETPAWAGDETRVERDARAAGR
jgi:hypothetical protein